MNARNPGCLSLSGFVAAGLTLLIVGGISLLRGGTLFSPGPLNAQEGSSSLGGISAHAELGGRCAACHTAFWDRETMSDRCLTCHESVALEINDSKGLHGILVAGRPTLDCRQCHTEHQGESAVLTRLDVGAFPHETLGFSLSGHARQPDSRDFECQDCHVDRLSDFSQARCVECHTDLDARFMAGHSRVFGVGCLNCHDGIDTYGSAFSHDQTGFMLEGEHLEPGCEGCHAGAVDLVALQNTPVQCFACHAEEDAHAGRFGTDCAACHTPDGWEGAEIDHELTGFPLVGRHAQVDCEDCHLDGTFAGTPQDCVACHAEDDAHAGEFGTDCAACHTPEGWDQVNFDHDLAAFPLTGAHTLVACTACHEGNVFRGTPTQCLACHTEPIYHEGLFAAECDACHSTAAWRPAEFSDPHRFPFNHGEQMSSCTTCHPDVLREYTCYGCHEHDPGEIAEEHLDEGISNFQDCARCHPTGLKEEGEGRESD